MGALEVLRELKQSYGLSIPIRVKRVDGPLFLAETVREDDGYLILLSQDHPYLVHHEFYHILIEERLMKPLDRMECEYCGKIYQEMLNAATDVLVERRVHDTNPNLFPEYYPTLRESIERSIHNGTITYDPTRTVAYLLYLQSITTELYPSLELNVWDQMHLPDWLDRRLQSAFLILGDLTNERIITWRTLRDTAIQLSRELYEAKPMTIEGPNDYILQCITDHEKARQTVETLRHALKQLGRQENQ